MAFEKHVIHDVTALATSGALARPSGGAGCLVFGRALRLLPCFVCAGSGGSGGAARLRGLTWAFAGRLCEKCHRLVSWLNVCTYGFIRCLHV